MLIPPQVVQGKIERRILLNYRIAPEIAARHIPAPYRPKLHRGYAIGGVCLIRISKIRPRYAPPIFGLSSENAACRFAVEWENKKGETCEGMHILHRDTSMRLGALWGGALTPRSYAHARFSVYESFDELFIEMRARRKEQPSLVVQGHTATEMPHDSIFRNTAEASDFFSYHCDEKNGGATREEFGGLKLRRRKWQLVPMEISCMRSDFFDDTGLFPEGSIRFDSGLLLRGTATEWVKVTRAAHTAEIVAPVG